MGGMTGEVQIRRVKFISYQKSFGHLTHALFLFFVVCENRVPVNRRTLPVERRKSAFQITTGKISNANGNATSVTQEPHAVSLLATGLALFDLKTTLNSGNMVDAN